VFIEVVITVDDRIGHREQVLNLQASAVEDQTWFFILSSFSFAAPSSMGKQIVKKVPHPHRYKMQHAALLMPNPEVFPSDFMSLCHLYTKYDAMQKMMVDMNAQREPRELCWAATAQILD